MGASFGEAKRAPSRSVRSFSLVERAVPECNCPRQHAAQRGASSVSRRVLCGCAWQNVTAGLTQVCRSDLLESTTQGLPRGARQRAGFLRTAPGIGARGLLCERLRGLLAPDAVPFVQRANEFPPRVGWCGHSPPPYDPAPAQKSARCCRVVEYRRGTLRWRCQRFIVTRRRS